MKVTIDSMVRRWKSAERPLLKGKLIDDNGCKCAQGDVLACCGYTDEQLRAMYQADADRETARRLGISVAHSILLRQQNDKADGCPQDVLENPEKVLGPHANLVLAFWHHLDTLTPAQLHAVRDVAWWESAADRAADSAVAAAVAAAWTAARTAARAAAGDAAVAAAGDAGAAAGDAWATYELQGWSKLKVDPYFLPLFGITDPKAWVASVEAAR